jgi:DNA-directed RNA polymerase specialized sigma subunit
MNGPFGEQYRNVLGKTDATSDLAKSNLALVDKVIQKLKKKGLSNTAIKKKLDEVLDCKK